MTFDSQLADRVRQLVTETAGISERRMFGGLAFLLHGHIAVVVSGKGGLMLRVDASDAKRLIATPGVEFARMRGRALAGWIRVDAERTRSPQQLERWTSMGLAFASTLPAKT